jgi:hypothetical protein
MTVTCGKLEKLYPFRSCVGFCPVLIEMQFSVGLCPIKPQNTKIETNINWVSMVCYMFKKKKEISLV